MAQVKVIALTNTAGSYGFKTPDDEPFFMEKAHAQELEKKGVIKIKGKVSAAEQKAAEEKAAKNLSTTTSISTAEKQYSEGPAGETDPKNPTQDKTSKKASKKAKR